jgi:hypothetical protein
VWGQEDKWPGDNSYSTTAMSVGDLVVEKFYPGLSACAPGGEYQVTVEAYDPKTGQVAAVDGGGSTVNLASVNAGASEANRLQDLEIDRTIDLDIAPHLHLLGLTQTPQDLKPGAPFALSLFWRGEAAGFPVRNTPVVLRDSADKQFPLANPAVSVPGADSGLCTFLDLRTPADAATGPAALVVGGAEISTVNVER